MHGAIRKLECSDGHRFDRFCWDKDLPDQKCDRCGKAAAPADTAADEQADLMSQITTGATNARARFASKYPYASMRLPKRMAGLPHADGKTKYGKDPYIAGPGTTIIPDAKTERELMAGRFNGERYARD